jgi:DNA polymerase-3 subunit alpha (Gram-positive type)
MIADLFNDKQFQELEKEYKFLARARGEKINQLDYVVFDIETTGLDPLKNEITEIGALKIKGKELENVFSHLIKPAKPIPPEITRLTGIDDEIVKDSPLVKEIIPKFIDFIGSSALIAHNAEFDFSFIKAQSEKLGLKPLDNSVICTVKIARYLIPHLQNHKLHTVASHFGLRVQNRHRAIGDVELTFQIWVNFLPMLEEKGIVNKRDLDSLLAGL